MAIVFIVNKKRIQTLESLRSEFCLKEVWAYAKSGRLAKWLEQIGEEELATKVFAVNIDDASNASCKKLMKIFGIPETKQQEELNLRQAAREAHDKEQNKFRYCREALSPIEIDLASARVCFWNPCKNNLANIMGFLSP